MENIEKFKIVRFHGNWWFSGIGYVLACLCLSSTTGLVSLLIFSDVVACKSWIGPCTVCAKFSSWDDFGSIFSLCFKQFVRSYIKCNRKLNYSLRLILWFSVMLIIMCVSILAEFEQGFLVGALTLVRERAALKTPFYHVYGHFLAPDTQHFKPFSRPTSSFRKVLHFQAQFLADFG